MNKRQKKKLENRAGFFHYRDYKLRVKILYSIFGSVVNHDGPYAFKQYMFNCAKTILFTKPRELFRGTYPSVPKASSACEAMGMEVD